MTLKEVQVSDKETVFNVPVEIPDEDIIEEYNTQNLSSEERRQALWHSGQLRSLHTDHSSRGSSHSVLLLHQP